MFFMPWTELISGEADDESSDDESYLESDDESLLLRERRGIKPGRLLPYHKPVRSAVVTGPGGTAAGQVNFREGLIQESVFRETVANIRAEVGKADAAINALDKRVSALSSNVKQVGSSVQEAMMTQFLFSSFLTQTPSLTSLTLGSDGADITKGAPVTVTASTFTEQDALSKMLPLFLIGGMGGGGIFGGTPKPGEGAGLFGGGGGIGSLIWLIILPKLLGK
jgi:hypothetical protein